MLFAAGRAAREVGAQAGERGVDVAAGELELHVPVELLEAGLAADSARRPEEAAQLSLQIAMLGHFVSSRNDPIERPHVVEVAAKLPASVVERLVERAATRVEAVCEDVDRHAVQRERDEHAALVRRQDVLDRVLQRREQLSSAPLPVSGARPALEKSDQASGSSGTSRPCQARFRSFTAASSSANL